MLDYLFQSVPLKLPCWRQAELPRTVNIAAMLVMLATVSGCGPSLDGNAPAAGTDNTGAKQAPSTSGRVDSAASLAPQAIGASAPNAGPRLNANPSPGQSLATASERVDAGVRGAAPPALSGEMPTDSKEPAVLGRKPQLPAGWKPDQLVSFLGDVDREMRLLINGQAGITDPAEIEAELTRVVVLKRTASERLMQHVDSSPADLVVGQRGFLQALSHLASLGDYKAAEELQAFAERFRDAPNPELRSDSQLVLIGFAIESVRHGKDAAAARVLRLVQELMEGSQPVDVASLMVLGQAKDTLLQYEYVDEATEVRQLILARFASTADPEVARMAAMIASAGFSQADSALQRLDQLRQQFAADSDPHLANAENHLDAPVSVAAWQAAIDEVLFKPADILTVEFLAGVSLEAEARGRGDIAAATYDVLKKDFSERQDALGQVARTALRARHSRESVIGQTFDPDLPAVDGRPLRMSDYRGKVVMMPFWSSAFPDSLAVLPNLLDIQEQYPDRVAIVGMNLDVRGASVQGFVAQQGLSFPSFRSESDPAAEIVNEVAYRFGAVTLLFVAVIDQEGRVAHLEFSGADLTPEIEKLIR